jgi:4-hydroxybenzoate polyprenyltransferase
MKDFRDREGDAMFGRRSILLLHGKGATCVLSGVLVGVGNFLLCLALGVQSWPLLVVAQGFFATIALMLWRLWKATAPRSEQVAIGTGAKMANGLLLSLLSWLLALGHDATFGTSTAFLVVMMALYGASFLILAKHPENAVIGYKG